MQIHLRIQRWVMWWFYLGVICGAIALVNILGRQLTHAQEAILLAFGAAHWLLGGIVCWAFESVRVEAQRESSPESTQKPQYAAPEKEWHPASDFLLPGGSTMLLAPRR